MFFTWCSTLCFSSGSHLMSVCSVVSGSDLHLWSRLANLVARPFSIWSSSSHYSISCWAAAISLLRPSSTGSLTFKSLTSAAKLSLRSQILANLLTFSKLAEWLESIISSWTSYVALNWLIAWSDRIPEPSSRTFIWFLRYYLVRSSVGWKPVVAEVLNLLRHQQNGIRSGSHTQASQTLQ